MLVLSPDLNVIEYYIVNRCTKSNNNKEIIRMDEGVRDSKVAQFDEFTHDMRGYPGCQAVGGPPRSASFVFWMQTIDCLQKSSQKDTTVPWSDRKNW